MHSGIRAPGTGKRNWVIRNAGENLFQGFLDSDRIWGFLALPAIEATAVVFNAKRDTHRSSPGFVRWTSHLGLAPFLQQFLGFCNLITISFGNHFIENFSRTFQITHGFIGNGKIKFGGGFIPVADRLIAIFI